MSVSSIQAGASPEAIANSTNLSGPPGGSASAAWAKIGSGLTIVNPTAISDAPEGPVQKPAATVLMVVINSTSQSAPPDAPGQAKPAVPTARSNPSMVSGPPDQAAIPGQVSGSTPIPTSEPRVNPGATSPAPFAVEKPEKPHPISRIRKPTKKRS